jgi:cytochrome c oxidase assembly factor CtaG
LCPLAAGLAAVGVAVPPLYGLAHRYELVQAVQFSVFAMVVPALVVTGAPRGSLWPRAHRFLEHAAAQRVAHPEPFRAVALLALFMCAAIAWRTPGAVEAIGHNPWLLGVEALSLVAIGVGFWSELLEAGPLVPRTGRPFRAVMAAVAMWTVWTISYLAGFSSTSWYTGFDNVVGHGLSAAADQQFATGVAWLIAAVVFMPVVFSSLITWLRSEDGLDGEVHRSAVRPGPG